MRSNSDSGSSRVSDPGGQVLPALGLMLVFALGAASTAGANTIGGLAAPGPCAEPREAVSGASQAAFSAVGPLVALFSPADVAAAPAPPARSGPSPSAPIRPGPCDNPGAGCGLLPVTTAIATPPIGPGTRPKASGDPVSPPRPSKPMDKPAWQGKTGKSSHTGPTGKSTWKAPKVPKSGSPAH